MATHNIVITIAQSEPIISNWVSLRTQLLSGMVGIYIVQLLNLWWNFKWWNKSHKKQLAFNPFYSYYILYEGFMELFKK